MRTGTVVRVDHGGRRVALDAPDGAEPGAVPLRCRVRGTLKRDLKRDGRDKVVVGDRVRVQLVATGDEGVIEEVLPRRSRLARRAAGDAHREQVSAANVDRIACVVACVEPQWKPGFVDRVLCAAERTGIPATIVMNKVDLLDDEDREALAEMLEPYAAIDVPVIGTSAETGEGIDALRAHLAGRTTVVTGPSGAGKTSLLNRVQPGLGLATAEVSDTTGKGRHTTTAVSMHALASGGAVIDTPGVRAFGFYDISARELGWLFKDLRPYAYHDGDADAPRCRFHDCLHRGEPGCEVQRAVEAGRLSETRYDSYRRILDDISDPVRG